MMKYWRNLFLVVSVLVGPLMARSQDLGERQLVWERNLIDIGTVMQEQGEVVSEFFFVNKVDFPIFIQEIITDCGCTTASYTTDTLAIDKIGSVKISYKPEGRGGPFSKTIIVKTNIDSEGDSLFLEGYNLPLPENIERHYSEEIEGLGFYSPTINMGNVINNEPKIKRVDFFNYRKYPIMMNEVRTQLPDHVQAQFVPRVVPGTSRGILELTYDGAARDDLGFFQDSLEIVLIGNEERAIRLKLTAAVHEYFPPVALSEVDNLPKLVLSEVEVDLNNINQGTPVSKNITLSNEGGAPLNIRKIVSNCDCLTFLLDKKDLDIGEKAELVFTFDPKGRRGIDHKTLTIFSNDPVLPTRTVMIRSRIR